MRMHKIEELDLDMKAYQRKLAKYAEDTEENQDNKTKIRLAMCRLSESIDDLKDEGMTEDKFWGLMALNDDEAFDYGRDTIKDGTHETRVKLPYMQLPLFTPVDWYPSPLDKPIVQVGGILRSGNLSGASIKVSLAVTLAEESEEGSDEEDGAGNNTTAATTADKAKKKIPETKWEQVLETCDEVEQDFPFDMLREPYLKNLS